MLAPSEMAIDLVPVGSTLKVRRRCVTHIIHARTQIDMATTLATNGVSNPANADTNTPRSDAPNDARLILSAVVMVCRT